MDTIDIDATKPAGWYHTPLEHPIFCFPTEKRPVFTAADIIAILKLYKPTNITKTKIELPKSLQSVVNKKGGRTRRIIATWPRPPNGKIYKGGKVGKQAPNGNEFWGATILDFYWIYRKPGFIYQQTITTGSKVLAWARENDEMDYAKDEITLAELEDDPELIFPWSPREAIEQMEEQIRHEKVGKSLHSKGKAASTGSMFDLSMYPAPWPLVPFSYPTETLSSTINHADLPQTLIVHDPCDLLSIDGSDSDVENLTPGPGPEAWTSEPDRTIVFKLTRDEKSMKEPEAHPQTNTHQPSEESKRAEKSKKDKSHYVRSLNDAVETFFLEPPTTLGPVIPPILVGHQAAPPSRKSTQTQPTTPIREAHLYLWPSLLAGQGHHSFVYRAELELPRSVLFPDPPDYVLCPECVKEDVNRYLRSVDGENGELMNPLWKEKSAEVVKVYNGRGPIQMHLDSKGTDDPGQLTDSYFESSKPHLEYKGAIRYVYTSVEWQDRMNPTCKHFSRPPPVPPTVKVSVIAKLSIEHDGHLLREARNYQRFPRHLFEHWSGLNYMPDIPMHDPVPIAPVVPQFFGYYVPEKSREDGGAYVSPILLMEDCGKQAEFDELTTDQRNEAVSLLLRFHQADWYHGSVYPRNILFQPGPLTVPPEKRSPNDPSFRLVDFGRSSSESSLDARSWRSQLHIEQRAVQEMFDSSPLFPKSRPGDDG